MPRKSIKTEHQIPAAEIQVEKTAAVKQETKPRATKTKAAAPRARKAVAQPSAPDGLAALALAVEPAGGDPREAIARLAYLLWEERGRPAGSDMEDWLRAEQALRAS